MKPDKRIVTGIAGEQIIWGGGRINKLGNAKSKWSNKQKENNCSSFEYIPRNWSSLWATKESEKEDVSCDEDSTDNEPSNIAANDEYAPNACGKHPLHIVLDMLTL